MTFQLTEAQREIIADRWNDLANSKHQISADQVHSIFSDNADADLAESGETQIEVRATATKSGAPETFYVDRDDVCMDSADVA